MSSKAMRPSPSAPWSGCPTRTSARRSPPPWCSVPAATAATCPRSCAPAAPRGWPPTSVRAAGTSSPSCRGRRPGRCASTSCARCSPRRCRRWQIGDLGTARQWSGHNAPTAHVEQTRRCVPVSPTLPARLPRLPGVPLGAAHALRLALPAAEAGADLPAPPGRLRRRPRPLLRAVRRGHRRRPPALGRSRARAPGRRSGGAHRGAGGEARPHHRGALAGQGAPAPGLRAPQRGRQRRGGDGRAGGCLPPLPGGHRGGAARGERPAGAARPAARHLHAALPRDLRPLDPAALGGAAAGARRAGRALPGAGLVAAPPAHPGGQLSARPGRAQVPPPVPLPRYGSAALADLVPSLLSALGAPGFANPLGVEPAASVCVAVIDGLGAELVAEHAAEAPFLTACGGTALTAGFPATTAASLASLGTGRPPGEHGLVGYTMLVPGQPVPMNNLTWAPYGLQPGGDGGDL